MCRLQTEHKARSDGNPPQQLNEKSYHHKTEVESDNPPHHISTTLFFGDCCIEPIRLSLDKNKRFFS